MLINLINSVVNYCSEIMTSEEIEIVIDSIRTIIPDYTNTHSETTLSIEEFLLKTSGLDEKNKKRKEFGVYYTPKDLCKFIISKMINREDNLFDKKIFEPTCGNSEFLLEYFNYICNLYNIEDDENIIEFTKKLYGNDVNCEALKISKIRILFNVLEKLNDKKNIRKLPTILIRNFYNIDAVNNLLEIHKKFDYIIGNPPYVETKNYPEEVNENFGNIYANILKNSIFLLKNDGVLAFVIPISYISTPRMKKIRNYIKNNTKMQIIYNFSDRPDSLFSSVHQKLNVIILKNGDSQNHKIFTSNYTYWYKTERERMFQNIQVVSVKAFDEFIPKLGNELEKNIFNKLIKKDNDLSLKDKLENSVKEELNNKIFINMRATFWIKCFMDEAKSKEYKTFFVDEDKEYLYCLFNSSLFFWYWVVVSDCWHITNKELAYFKFISSNNNLQFELLSKELEKKLDDTKLYIGSKQSEFEYKHKECKDIIDRIDDIIGKVYSLTEKEISYIKKCNEKYRLSKGE